MPPAPGGAVQPTDELFLEGGRYWTDVWPLAHTPGKYKLIADRGGRKLGSVVFRAFH